MEINAGCRLSIMATKVIVSKDSEVVEVGNGQVRMRNVVVKSINLKDLKKLKKRNNNISWVSDFINLN